MIFTPGPDRSGSSENSVNFAARTGATPPHLALAGPKLDLTGVYGYVTPELVLANSLL